MSSMNGKTVIVTGGTGGIGKQTAIALAKLGAHVVITGRDKGRSEQAQRDIQAHAPQGKVDVLLADLSVLAEVKRLADDIQSRYSRLDVLINNVGLLETEKRHTTDGIEAHFAVNVLTPFVLTHLLLPLLQKSTPSQVVNLTGGLPGTKLEIDNLQAEKSFRGLPTYSRSKQAMMAMSVEFAERLKGMGVAVNVAYPGAAATAMTGAMNRQTLPLFMQPFYPVFKQFMKADNGESAAKAARSSIYLASHPEVQGKTGIYVNTSVKQVPFPAQALDPHNREVIWALCERLGGRVMGSGAIIYRPIPTGN
jgi:NAD(P)-dependent dehydrogenase (short-subunit alcohol dehydrogenase family)